MADDVQTVTQGEFVIRARDATSGTLTVTATVVPAGTPSTQSREFLRVSGATLPSEDSTPEDTRTLDHPKFFQARDTLVRDDVVLQLPDGAQTSNADELREELPVTIVP